MKIGLVSKDDVATIVLQAETGWIDFSRAYQAYRLLAEGVAADPVRSILELLSAGIVTPAFLTEVLALLEDHALLDRCRVSPPERFALPLRPEKVIGLGRNYFAQAPGDDFSPPEEPVVFSKSSAACIGDGEPIIVRESYGRVDPEAELAIVIGRTAKFLDEGEAADYIAGYTLLNDVTARSLQQSDISAGLPWFRSKSIDTFCPLGPVITLPDEMPWPLNVDMELRVNGEVRQKSNTSRFIFSIPEVLSFVSRYVTLVPGDIVSTGTPEGSAPMAPGDVVEIEVPEIGILRNPVAPAGARVLV